LNSFPEAFIDDGLVLAVMELALVRELADIDILRQFPPFAPLAARWALTMELSMKNKLSSQSSASASKIDFQMPRRAQRA